MNPSDKYEQIKDIKRLNPVELEAMVLQEIKDIAKHLRALNKKEKKEWVGLTDEDFRKLADKHLFYQPEDYEVSGVFALARAIEAKLKEKNNG